MKFIQRAQFQIPLLYCYSFFWMFMLFMPILIPFLLSHNLSMQEIFWLQVIFGTGVLILEVPSGYLADVWGRKRTLQLGALFYGLGYACLAQASSWWDFVLFELLLSVAMSMSSGTDMALLYAWINRQSRAQATQMIARRQMAGVSAEAVASLLSGVLISGGFALVMGAQSLVGCIPLLLTLLIYEAPFERAPKGAHKQNFNTVIQQIWFDSKLLRLIFLNMSFWSLSTFVAVWTFQKYWQDLGIELKYFGLLWALYNLIVGLTGLWVSKLEARFGAMSILWILAILPILGFLGMGLSHSIWGIVLGLGFQVSRGLAQVQLRDAFNWRLPDTYRATANSIASFVFRLEFALLGPLAGWWIDKYSLSSALLFLAVFFTLGLPLLVWPLQRAFRLEAETAAASAGTKLKGLTT